MNSSRIKLWPVLAGTAAVCVTTWAVALLKPHCKDSAFKLALVLLAYWAQWLVIAAALGVAVRERGLIHGLIFGVMGSLLSAVLWLGLLWGWRVFSLRFYWDIWSSSTLFDLPLAALGGWLGSFCYARFRPPESVA